MLAAPLAVLAVLYAGGYLAQFIGNYAVWQQGGGVPGDGTSPVMPTPNFFTCLASVFRPPYGVYGVLICIGLFAVLLIMVMRLGYSEDGEYDQDRNFTYSKKGTYGTSGWMNQEEMDGVLELVSDLRSHPGTILGTLNHKVVCCLLYTSSSGHFIVLRGVQDGKIMVADPGSYKRSNQLWDLSIILNEASRRAAAGGPFWIIG